MKGLRGYAAALTTITVEIVSMAMYWTFTRLPIEDILFRSCGWAFIALFTFIAATEPRKKKVRWITDNNGLSYMLQDRPRHKAKGRKSV